MKKFLCGMMAVLMACSATGCSDKENSSSTSGKQLVSDAGDDVNVAEEDMPYGSTVFELSENNDDHVKITIGFDKRYFGGDDEDNPDYSEIYKIHDYISALNSMTMIYSNRFIILNILNMPAKIMAMTTSTPILMNFTTQ